MGKELWALTAIGLSVGAVRADIINVPGDYESIQAAVDAAVDGDEVVVADGVYTGPGNREVQTGTKLITVRSAGGPDVCVIDCEGTGPAFFVSGGARVEGFTVRNGHSVQGGALYIGGDAMIVACVFDGNTADAGGGAYVLSSSPTFMECTFTDNFAQVVDGGAIYNLYGSPRIVNCLFTGNCAAAFGGAIFSDLAMLNLVNCTLSDNSAFRGGGITNYAGVEMTLSNCILWGNRDFKGGGFYAQILSTSSTEIVNYTCVEGLDDILGGEGNIDADPLFVDPANDDFRLQSGSPAIDAGHNWAIVGLADTDLDDNPRFADEPATADTGCGVPVQVDMGAYEFQGAPFDVKLGDIDGDGVVSTADLLDLLPVWGEMSKECQLADLDLDGEVGTSDLLILLGNWG